MSNRYAVLEVDLVVNIALAADDFAAEQGWLRAPDEVGPGWTFDGQRFNPPVPLSGVPEAITMRQARLALLGSGKLALVDAAIAAIPGIEGDAARIEWEYAQDVRRASPLVAALGPALGLQPAQIDALFVAGATL